MVQQQQHNTRLVAEVFQLSIALGKVPIPGGLLGALKEFAAKLSEIPISDLPLLDWYLRKIEAVIDRFNFNTALITAQESFFQLKPARPRRAVIDEVLSVVGAGVSAVTAYELHRLQGVVSGLERTQNNVFVDLAGMKGVLDASVNYMTLLEVDVTLIEEGMETMSRNVSALADGLAKIKFTMELDNSILAAVNQFTMEVDEYVESIHLYLKIRTSLMSGILDSTVFCEKTYNRFCAYMKDKGHCADYTFLLRYVKVDMVSENEEGLVFQLQVPLLGEETALFVVFNSFPRYFNDSHSISLHLPNKLLFVSGNFSTSTELTCWGDLNRVTTATLLCKPMIMSSARSCLVDLYYKMKTPGCTVIFKNSVGPVLRMLSKKSAIVSSPSGTTIEVTCGEKGPITFGVRKDVYLLFNETCLLKVGDTWMWLGENEPTNFSLEWEIKRNEFVEISWPVRPLKNVFVTAPLDRQVGARQYAMRLLETKNSGMQESNNEVPFSDKAWQYSNFSLLMLCAVFLVLVCVAFRLMKAKVLRKLFESDEFKKAMARDGGEREHVLALDDVIDSL